MLSVLLGSVIKWADEKGNKRLLHHYRAQAVTQTAPDMGFVPREREGTNSLHAGLIRGHRSDAACKSSIADALQKPRVPCDLSPKMGKCPEVHGLEAKWDDCCWILSPFTGEFGVQTTENAPNSSSGWCEAVTRCKIGEKGKIVWSVLPRQIFEPGNVDGRSYKGLCGWKNHTNSGVTVSRWNLEWSCSLQLRDLKHQVAAAKPLGLLLIFLPLFAHKFLQISRFYFSDWLRELWAGWDSEWMETAENRSWNTEMKWAWVYPQANPRSC